MALVYTHPLQTLAVAVPGRAIQIQPALLLAGGCCILGGQLPARGKMGVAPAHQHKQYGGERGALQAARAEARHRLLIRLAAPASGVLPPGGLRRSELPQLPSLLLAASIDGVLQLGPGGVFAVLAPPPARRPPLLLQALRLLLLLLPSKRRQGPVGTLRQRAAGFNRNLSKWYQQ